MMYEFEARDWCSAMDYKFNAVVWRWSWFKKVPVILYEDPYGDRGDGKPGWERKAIKFSKI